MINILNEELGTTNNPIPFPITSIRINDYTYPSIQSLVFPTLFPFGLRDMTDWDRISFVSLTNSNKHLLKYSIYNPQDDAYISVCNS